MRVFVTGSTGFIGTEVVKELIAAGHQVLGLCRDEAKAAALATAGAEVHRGTLQDLASLKAGAAQSDGIIHLAFNHDFSRFEQNAADEREAIAAMGEALAGSRRPFIVTSGTAMADNADGRPSAEDSPRSSWNPRTGLETVIDGFRDRGAVTSIVRLPQVHDTRKQGLVPYLLAVTRLKGVSAYLGDGGNRWPAAHVSDVARLYRLALESAEPGAIYHAVDEEGISLRAIAEAHGRGLKVPVVSISPEDAEAHFGWMATFARLDMPSSSRMTRQKLNWRPTGPGLIADLDSMDYGQA